MKKFLLTITLLVTAFTFCFAQTATTDSGTVSRTDPRLYKYGASGTVAGTDNNLTKAFDPLSLGYSNIVDTWFSLTSAADSADLTVILQEYSISGKWVNLKTLWTAQTTAGNYVSRDTINISAEGLRYSVAGVDSNGYSTGYELKFGAVKAP